MEDHSCLCYEAEIEGGKCWDPKRKKNVLVSDEMIVSKSEKIFIKEGHPYSEYAGLFDESFK